MQRSQWQMEGFKSAVDSCGVKNLGYIGPHFTWCNMQEGKDRVYLRLDRALATQNWIDKYKEARVHHIVDLTSDHFALLVLDSFIPQHLRKRRFHFKAMWIKKKECKDIIEAAWRNSINQNTPSGMVERLNECVAKLNSWNLATFRQVPKLI